MDKKGLPPKAKPTLKEYLQVALVMTIIVGSVALTVRYLTLKKIEEVNEINKDYSLTEGMITEMGYTPRKHIRVQFVVKGVTIKGIEWIRGFRNKKLGDSIGIKYSNKDPEHFITELHIKY